MWGGVGVAIGRVEGWGGRIFGAVGLCMYVHMRVVREVRERDGLGSGGHEGEEMLNVCISI